MARRVALDGWSRLVAALKVLLPLTALAILSMLFLISNRINPDDALPYAEVDVEARLKEPRMTAPTYAGTTSDGASLEVTAAEARPAAEGETGANAIGVQARLSTPDGQQTDLEAATAQMTLNGTEITFSGDVRLTHSSGYRVTSDEMTARLGETDVQARSAVAAEGPGGRITAQSMRLMPAGDGSEGYLLVFNGAVKLVYQPAK
ncbi:MAG: LPS export ABC transporter periplasmic protein LptC [Fuscovulum sp.]|jgi:lipopolysaccharide export system protein LptC|nr:LPS export ABC transporter periplasmic protein LptC [Paracoccaceae bacterium]MCZ8081696.1 LPS export ABC transporter periplasmic protein LptC [Paracoccaceae bacterium]WRH62964.1 MAG: LPS export ABC transporter periplasmic protein LptC [Fuscovulum sp.]